MRSECSTIRFRNSWVHDPCSNYFPKLNLSQGHINKGGCYRKEADDLDLHLRERESLVYSWHSFISKFFGSSESYLMVESQLAFIDEGSFERSNII